MEGNMKKIMILKGGEFHPYNQFVNILKENFKNYEFEVFQEKNIFASDKIFNYEGLLIYTDTKISPNLRKKKKKISLSI
jgi:hypothetical protein